MNLILTTLIVSAVIAILAVVTRTKKGSEEPAIGYGIKIAVISFVVVYFGMTFLNTSNCPDFHMGDPDF